MVFRVSTKCETLSWVCLIYFYFWSRLGLGYYEFQALTWALTFWVQSLGRSYNALSLGLDTLVWAGLYKLKKFRNLSLIDYNLSSYHLQPPPPPRILKVAICGENQVIFGQIHLIFGQALDRIFGQETSAPNPERPDPVRLSFGIIKGDLQTICRFSYLRVYIK